MRVRITHEARSDLEQISDLIAEDSPTRADSFVLELLDRCQSLTRQSSRYPVVTRWRERDLRRCPFGNYLIFYSIVGDGLEVNHIVHSAQDYSRILFPDD